MTFGETIEMDEAWQYYNALLLALDEYLVLMDDFRAILSEDLTDENNRNNAVVFLDNRLSPLSSECLECMTELNRIRLELGQILIDKATDYSNHMLTIMVIISVAGIALSVVLGIFLSRYISKPILKGVEIMSKAAGGDFSVRLSQEYGAELGKLYAAFNALVEYNRINIAVLTDSSSTMRDSAQNMLSISTVMADNSCGLNEQTSLVSSTVEEFSAGMMQTSSSLSTASVHVSAVASSIEEINSTIGAVAAAAEQTSVRVGQSSNLVGNIKNSISMASSSVTVVSDAFNSVATSVDEINRSIIIINEHCVEVMGKVVDADQKAQNANHIIKQLEAASKQIGKIVGIISDVADQTNMLSLNAAIEAAGAGDAGRGFMVVANEVKELARQTADATNEISEQIENIQNSVPEAVEAVAEITDLINLMIGFMESLTLEVDEQGQRSVRIADESAAAARRMNELSTEIGRISENASSVTLTVAESTKGVNEIAKSTSELVIGTQEIAMNSEHLSNNIREIDRSTREMSAGLADISQNIQLIHAEAGSVQNSANQTNRSSEELLRTSSEMEKFVGRFKLK